MRLVLKDTKRASSYIDLKPETHRVAFLNRRSDRQAFSGFGCVERVFGIFPRLCAVYGSEGKIWFQTGAHRWDVTEGVSNCRWQGFCSLFFSEFSITFQDGTSHNVKLFHPIRALTAKIDPTYDGIDSDSDHFLLFIGSQIGKPEWRQYVASLGSAFSNHQTLLR